jgi:hypothetical protein
MHEVVVCSWLLPRAVWLALSFERRVESTLHQDPIGRQSARKPDHQELEAPGIEDRLKA